MLRVLGFLKVLESKFDLSQQSDQQSGQCDWLSQQSGQQSGQCDWLRI